MMNKDYCHPVLWRVISTYFCVQVQPLVQKQAMQDNANAQSKSQLLFDAGWCVWAPRDKVCVTSLPTYMLMLQIIVLLRCNCCGDTRLVGRCYVLPQLCLFSLLLPCADLPTLKNHLEYELVNFSSCTVHLCAAKKWISSLFSLKATHYLEKDKYIQNMTRIFVIWLKLLLISRNTKIYNSKVTI